MDVNNLVIDMAIIFQADYRLDKHCILAIMSDMKELTTEPQRKMVHQIVQLGKNRVKLCYSTVPPRPGDQPQMRVQIIRHLRGKGHMEELDMDADEYRRGTIRQKYGEIRPEIVLANRLITRGKFWAWLRGEYDGLINPRTASRWVAKAIASGEWGKESEEFIAKVRMERGF